MAEDASPSESGACAMCSAESSVQCLICLRRGARPAPTFCGSACYREHWKTHRGGGGDGMSPSSSPELKSCSPSPQPSPPQPSPPPRTYAPIHSMPQPAGPLHQVPGGKHIRPQAHSGHTRHASRRSFSWNSLLQGSPAGCHPPQWYPDGKWVAGGLMPGLGQFPRAVPQEQMVGPTGWGGYGPSRFVDPTFKYWGNY